MSLRVIFAVAVVTALASCVSSTSLSSYAPADESSSEAIYTLTTNGTLNTTSYAVYFSQYDAHMSPWHAIPLFAGNDTVRFVAEIPKNTSAKYEAQTSLPYNPIKQDIKNGHLRFYAQDIPWNYGFLPQTWEDSMRADPETGTIGDNDPVDVLEIGSQAAETGGVYDVRIVGAYQLIDDGETDWKLLAIRLDDPLAESIYDLESLEETLPGELDRIFTWFRTYKIPDGDLPGEFGNNGEPVDVAGAWAVIEETHDFWLELKDGRTVVEDLILF